MTGEFVFESSQVVNHITSVARFAGRAKVITSLPPFLPSGRCVFFMGSRSPQAISLNIRMRNFMSLAASLQDKALRH